MKRILGLILIVSLLLSNVNVINVLADDNIGDVISENKIVTVSGGNTYTGVNPQTLVDGDLRIINANRYYYLGSNYPYFSIDLDGYYNVSKIEWYGRVNCLFEMYTTGIYGANKPDFSDQELITTVTKDSVETYRVNSSTSNYKFSYTIPEEKRNTYSYIKAQKIGGNKVTIGGIEFIVYGTEVDEFTAGSTEGEFSPAKAFDDNYDTYWLSSSVIGDYLQYDLIIPQNITEVRLSARHDVDNSAERNNFEIWLSNDSDFNNYVRVPCVSNETSQHSYKLGKAYGFKETYVRKIDLPDKYRYVRYVKTKGQASLSEFNVVTSEKAEDVVTNEITKDFETEYELKDSVGDTTNVFIPDSNIEIKGNIKNNSDTDKTIYAIAASYDKNNTLTAATVKEVEIKTGETKEFENTLATSDGEMKNFVFEKTSIKPLCNVKSIPKHIEKENAVYVSDKNGDDNNDGSVLAPFKTLERAKTEANKIKENGEVHIRIKNGEYYMPESLSISSSDSGIEDGYIIYEGFGTDETLINGGKKVSGFEPVDNGVYAASLEGVTHINDIYVNGERRNLAKSTVLLASDEVYDTENLNYGPVLSKHQLPENITFDSGMEIFYPSVGWRSYALKLNNITDNGDDTYTLNVKPCIPVNDRTTYNLLEKFDARAFYLRNSKQLLDEEGEWYFDNSESVLYYKPYSDENMDISEVTVSGIDTLVNLDNAKYISFEGLTFANTGWQKALENGEMRWQGHNLVLPVQYSMPPSAVYAKYSQYVDVKDCVFKNTGSVAIGFEWGMKNCNIVGNVFDNIADGAIYLGNYRDIEDSKFGKTVADMVENINVKNNVITNTGVNYHSAAAVQLYGGKNINIENNDISHCPYSAISVGPLVWSNNLAASDETHEAGMYGYNRICNNKMHEISKLNPDGAGVYTLGHNHGTVISGNYIKNQYIDYSAIYNDKGSACFEIYDNVLENVPGWLYEWSDGIYFINAHDNYSTTNENFGGFFCEKSNIEDVNIFQSHDKPEEVKIIIENSGLSGEYKEKLNKNIPEEPLKTSPVFEETDMITVEIGESVILSANFKANDSERFHWKALGNNKTNVTFKDSLHNWLKRGRQFEKIYASFSAAGTYEIVCEADDGRGYIYASKQFVTVN